jgi:hypothetical protein
MLGCVLEIHFTPSLFVKGDVMSLLHRVVLPALAVVGLGFLVACSSSSSHSTPPPSGGFSNTDFNGTYVFSISGSDSNGALSIAGAITACGCSNGSLSAGTVDVADSSGATGPVTITATGSGYSVNKDGTGTFKLALPLSTPIQYQFAFALTDAAHGLVSEYDSNGTGSGTIDLQPSSVTLSNASYAFSLSGAANVSTASDIPLGAAGAFTLSSSGLAGTADFNLYQTVQDFDVALSGSISAGSGTTPGTATFNSSFDTSEGFDVYAIDATHLKLIENDGSGVVLVGDLFSQPTATVPSGSLSFTMSGVSGTNPLAVGGTFSSDGSANFSGISEVVNNNGSVGTITSGIGGTFSAQPSGATYGRFLVDFTGFTGGGNFAAYPSSGGLLMLEVDSGAVGAGVTEGVAMTQNSPAGIVASQGYATNLTGGVVGGGEVDQIAQFNTGSSSLSSGTIYFNDDGAPDNYGLSSSSAYTSSEVTLDFNGNSEGVAYFGVDSATSLALGIDTTDVSLGVFEQQGSPTSTADVASRHLAMVKAAIRARAKKKKQQ